MPAKLWRIDLLHKPMQHYPNGRYYTYLAAAKNESDALALMLHNQVLKEMFENAIRIKVVEEINPMLFCSSKA